MIDYFFDVNADVLAITSFKRDKLERKEGSLNWNTLKYTLQDERFTNYSLIKIFSCNMARYYEYVFVRNDLFHKMFKEKN